MDIVSLIIIAFGLSMDSFAVSVANGLACRIHSVGRACYISFFFAFFQVLMPLLGWFSGIGLEKYIRDFDHWIAFGLLAFIGIKMIYESITGDDKVKNIDLKTRTIILQSFATSIDAFAVGFSFAVLNHPIITPILIIGVVTFLFSITGLFLGKYFGKRLGSVVEIFGGIVLIGIGIKILIEHLFFGA